MALTRRQSKQKQQNQLKVEKSSRKRVPATSKTESKNISSTKRVTRSQQSVSVYAVKSKKNIKKGLPCNEKKISRRNASRKGVIPPLPDMSLPNVTDSLSSLTDDSKENMLRKFDFDPNFGPCKGITRSARVQRGKRLMLPSPPSYVQAILEEDKNKFQTR